MSRCSHCCPSSCGLSQYRNAWNVSSYPGFSQRNSPILMSPLTKQISTGVSSSGRQSSHRIQAPNLTVKRDCPSASSFSVCSCSIARFNLSAGRVRDRCAARKLEVLNTINARMRNTCCGGDNTIKPTTSCQ